MLLEIQDLSAGYQKASILKKLNLAIDTGDCVALLGPNNAGKTTLLRCISGLIRPTAGAINFAGQDLTKLSTPSIVKLGIVQIPEGRHIFGDLTVQENLMVGGARLERHTRRSRLRELFELFPLLNGLRKRVAGSLSGGQQQLVVIARALMANPKLLLVDEPSLGLSPLAMDQVFDSLSKAHESGTAIFLAEQNADISLRLCERGYVMVQGEIKLDGDSDQIRAASLSEIYFS